MSPTPYLYVAFKGLNEAMKGSLNGSKIESIKETINNFAIASAVASMAAGVLPGVAGVVATLTQAGFVWGTYIKINKTLGISMSENTAKFIGSAIVTNLITSAGALLATYAGAVVLGLFPFFAPLTIFINGAIGYIIVYVAAVIYLRLITELIQPDGSLKVAENDDTKHIIKKIIKESDLKDIIKEGRNSYKNAKADGSIDKAQKHPKCPNCEVEYTPGQKFCSSCGTALK